MIDQPPLCQIAFSVMNLRRTYRWYQDAFGFVPSGGTRLFRGPLASRVQGLPNAASTCWWLVDQQDFFQLEMFQFASPPVRRLPGDWRACDIGYSMVGLHVADFEATLARLAAARVQLLTEPLGPAGARRACVRDPEGVLVEVMEDDPRLAPALPRLRPEIPVAARSITLSVPDLERSRRFFGDTLGLPEVPRVRLHGPEHEELWGLGGAQRQSLVLSAGELLVELVQYSEPKGKPRPEGYRISDQGLLNIALGFRRKADFDAAYARCLAAGHKGNWRPLNLGAWSVVYVNDDQGFSVELLFVRPWYDRPMGFRPARPYVVVRARIAAARPVVWERLCDHEGMVNWSPFSAVTLIRAGVPERNGLGAVRRMRGLGMTIEEEVVRWEPPARYDYRLNTGAPIRGHHGHVMLREVEGGTEVRWAIGFQPTVPGTGWLIRALLQRAIGDMLQRFKRQIESAA
jgi:catechol 2,3-dioxygenase-like lactoylglutathione lyase family enzyme